MVQYVLIAVAFFALGALVSGFTVYAVNLRKWHAAEMDAILLQLERVDGNLEKVNGNIKKAVSRFGVYSGKFEESMAGLDGSMERLSASTSHALREITDSQRGLAPVLEDIRSQGCEVGADVARVLERVKLLG